MPIRRVIDLSMPLDDRTPFYPGDPEPRVCAATTIAADGFNVARLELGSHAGTHCDAPERGVRTIGIDAINLDETPRVELDRSRFRCHAQVSAAGGVIVENLVGLGAIDFPDPFVSVLPLHVPRGDGAPARAVAIEGLA